MKKLVVVILIISIATPCLATTRLKKLSEDQYLLTHQKQSCLGGQGKALRMTYEKAGSLCVLLGHSWFEIKDTQSKGRGWGSDAAATVVIKFYSEREKARGEDLLNCEELASKRQKKKMKRALERIKN